MILNDVCELIVDCEHKTAPTQAEGFPSIRTPNIGKGYFLLDGVNRVSEETYLNWTRRATPKFGDLIMAREAPVGHVAMVSHGLKPCLGQRTLLIRPNQTKVSSRFLTYLLVGDEVQGVIHGMTNGATVPHLNMKDVRSLQLPTLPTLPTQHKIASILSAYDDLIENNSRRIAILESMAQAIYREWFVEFRFPGHENVKLVDSPLGMIPDGWVSTVGDFGKVTTGKTPTKTRPENFGGEIPFVKTPDMHGNLFCISTSETLSDVGAMSQSSQTVPPNSVCISCIGTVGVICITTATCQTNQQINTIVPHSQSWREFIVLTLQQSVPRLKQMGAAGATMDNISKGKLMSFSVLLPPKDILDRFSSLTLDLFDRIKILQKHTAVLRKTRDLLLPKLISGDLDVEDLDIETGEFVTE